MKKILKNILKGKVIIVGVGNRMRGDDGFGPELVDRLKGKIKAECLDVGNAPENYVGKIAKGKPDTVLVLDAVHLGKQPGEYEVLEKSDIANLGFTTHDIPLSMFMQFLENESGAKIYMLGVEPEKVSFGRGISLKISRALDEICDIIINAIKKRT